MSDVVFVDVETTGLDPDHHEIWEVALVPDSEDGWKESVWFLPVDLGRADSAALKTGGFHQRRNGVDVTAPDKFAHQFASLTRGKHLAGAVVSFDEERLRKLLRANGACPEWHYHLIDVETLAVGWVYGKYGTADEAESQALSLPWDSETVSRAVGVNPDNFDRHTALGDARWAKAVYEAVTE